LSVPTAEPSAPTLGAHHNVTGGVLSGSFSGWRLYGALIGAALLISALSLLIPSTPSYDPWSWLVWGREILHGSLHTPGGPTWKPLPVIFTTIFAIFGRAQPDLWLVVGRAGALSAVLMVFRLAARMTWWLRDADERELAGSNRIAAVGPAVLAGLVGLVALALTGEFLDSSALGYSEGLMVAATLIALDRHLDGHYRQAFVLGFVAALDRPEIWLFWGPYGLWLMWRDPGSRALVVSLAVLTLALWFVPQKLGGGSFTSGVSRAHHPRPNSAAYASCPFCSELVHHAWPLVLLRVKFAAALAVVIAVWLLWRGRRARAEAVPAAGSSWVSRVMTRLGLPLRTQRDRALFTLILSGGFGVSWWVIVGIETQAGFSGNDRYLVLGSAFICLTGGVAFGWAALGLARSARRAIASAGRRTRLVSASVVCALIFLFVPNWVGANLISIPRTHAALVYQANLRRDLVYLIDRHGGARKILACGPVMTEGFQVPMVAWYLNVRMIDVLDQPPVNAAGLDPVAKGQWPATIFQDSDTRDAALLPLPDTIIGWEREGAHYVYEPGPHHAFRFFQACRG
jgi:hypothetical protein